MKNTISIRSHIKLEDIASLLDSASRGSNYWCENELGYESETTKALSGEDLSIIDDFEERSGVMVRHFLDLKKIKKGLTIMAKKEPKHFADFISENFDETTGDVFLQCCLFGKVIYG